MNLKRIYFIYTEIRTQGTAMSDSMGDWLAGLSIANAGLQVTNQYINDKKAGNPYAFQRFGLNVLGSTARIGAADAMYRHTGSPFGYMMNSFVPYTDPYANIFALGGMGLGGWGAPFGFGFTAPMWGGFHHHHHHCGGGTSIYIRC